MNLSTARLYSKPHCVQCDATKRWLDGQGVDYDIIDLTESPDDMAAVAALGYKQAPVVAVADDVHWSGFNPGLLELHFGKAEA